MAKTKVNRNNVINAPLQKSKPFQAVSSGMNSLAQSTNLLELPAHYDKAIALLYGTHSKEPVWDCINLAVLELQVLWGLRISEVIGVRPFDVSPLGHVRIKGAKGSNDRYVMPHSYTSVWLNYVKCGNIIGHERNRYYYYHLYKNYGLYHIGTNSSNRSVTHAFRHSVVKLLQADGYTLNELQAFIGHKNQNNTKIYAK